MPTPLILATRNAGKIAEMSSFLQSYGFTVEAVPASVPDVEEIGTTFQANALLKARFVAQETGCLALADDSGLEIYALNNAPGVYSARYASRYIAEWQKNSLDPFNFIPSMSEDMHKSIDEHNIDLVLAAMHAHAQAHKLSERDSELGIPPSWRSARFRCCIAVAPPSKQWRNPVEMCAHGPSTNEILVHGVWDGRISLAPYGKHGFGYDPIFYDCQKLCTAAELSSEVKQASSHRGQALRNLEWAISHHQ